MKQLAIVGISFLILFLRAIIITILYYIRNKEEIIPAFIVDMIITSIIIGIIIINSGVIEYE